jgi:hypothetical protein
MRLINLIASRTGARSLVARQERKGSFWLRRLTRGVLLPGCTLALIGCINVAAPDEPIVIELNINIRQEVILRLAEDAADTVEENADIF